MAQMLSQSHDANYIQFWLTSWFADLKKPDEVIIDGSEALIRASVRSFTLYASANKYITGCMQALLHNGTPPRCFIRLDRSHFVRSIHANKMLQKLDQRVSRMIKGVIGYLIQCESIELVKQVLKHLFTLTRNPAGTEAVISAKNFLTQLVRTHESPFEEIYCIETENNQYEDNLDEKDTYRDTLAFKWLKDIYDSIPIQQAEDCESLPNIYYSKAVDMFLLEVVVRIPMWSNVMCGACGSSNLNPSSSGSESEFKNIKKLAGIKTKLVNVFVDLHCSHLSGNMKIRLGEQKNRALRENKKSPEDDIEKHRLKRSSSSTKINANVFRKSASKSENDISDVPSRCDSASENEIPENETRENEIPKENWKNKNASSPILRRSKTSILNRHDVNYQYNSVPLLKNAYTSAAKIQKKTVDLCNTCAYDSTFCIYSAAFLDEENLHVIIDSCDKGHMFSYRIKEAQTLQQKPKQLYVHKTEILFKLYSKYYKHQIVETANTISMKCTTAYGPFLEKLLTDIDSNLLCSVTEKRKCPQCHYQIEDNHALGKLRFIDKVHLQRLSSYLVINEDRNWHCRECDLRMLTTLEYGNIIAFDVEPTHRRFYYSTSIDMVQQTLHINESVYMLFAVVQFKPAIDHFLAHVKRSNGVWETYDDLEKDVKRSKNCTKTQMMIFAVFYRKITK